MMGVWYFCFEMGWRLRCEKSSSPVGEIRQGCFFCHNSSPQLQNPSLAGSFPTPWKRSYKAAFLSSLFLSKTHLILLSPNDTPQKTPPIVCFLKKRRAIVCTLAHESKKSCTRFLGCMIFTLYHQRYDCGGGEACSGITTYLQPFKMGKVRNCVIFSFFSLNRFNWVTMLMGFT